MSEFEKYNLSKKHEIELFQKAIIVFDTSSLLDFYSYSKHTQDEIIKTVFSKLKNRLWAPAQSYFEFMKNREKVMMKPIQSYKNLLTKKQHVSDSGDFEMIATPLESFQSKDLKNIKGILQTLIEKTSTTDKHPFFKEKYFSELKSKILSFEKQINATNEQIKSFHQQFKNDIEEKTKNIESIKAKDTILQAFNQFFSVGKEFTYEETLVIVSEGELRYRNQIPPGYEDQKEKSGFSIYGDLILWKQILKYSSIEKKPIIFVTNDNKKDWWQYENKQNLKKPRHELIQEIWSCSNERFWMYNSNDFLYKIKDILKFDLENSTIEEVKKINEEHNNQHLSNAILNWSSNYYNNWSDSYKIDGDTGIDYLIKNKGNEQRGIIIKKNVLYYSSLSPILRSLIADRGKIFQSNNITKLTLIFVYNNALAAGNMVSNLKYMAIVNMLEQSQSFFNLIIAVMNNKSKKLNIVHDTERDEYIYEEDKDLNRTYRNDFYFEEWDDSSD